MTDAIADYLKGAQREIRTVDRDGSTAHVLVATKTYATTPDDVWDAIADPNRLRRWFAPVSGELRQGGRYQIEGNAGGEITRCEPPRTLEATWEFGGGVSWLTVRLAPDAAGGTVLQLEHVAHVPADMWETYGPGAVGVGWEQGLFELGRHLAGEEVPPQGQRPSETRAFTGPASEGWARASIAAGTDEAMAMAASERTAAFFTA